MWYTFWKYDQSQTPIDIRLDTLKLSQRSGSNSSIQMFPPTLVPSRKTLCELWFTFLSAVVFETTIELFWSSLYVVLDVTCFKTITYADVTT